MWHEPARVTLGPMLQVTWGARHKVLEHGETLTIGRLADNDFVLDLTDKTIPRRAAVVRDDESGTWWVENTGSVTLIVEDSTTGESHHLASPESCHGDGRYRYPVIGEQRIVVRANRLHTIVLRPPSVPTANPPAAGDGALTIDTARVPLSAGERRTLIAFVAQAFLPPPLPADTRIVTAAEAAARISDVMTIKSVEKAVERVQRKFRGLQVPWEFASTQELIDHCRRVGMLTTDDLVLLLPDWRRRHGKVRGGGRSA